MQAGKFVSASEVLKETNNKLYPCYGANGLRGFTYSYNYEGEYSLIGRQGALCGNITRVYDKFYATEHAVVVTPKEEVHSTWLFYLLNYLNLNQYATGMAQPGLSVQNLLEVESIITDSIEEQEKIASLLLLIDSRIQTQKKIISQLKSQMLNLKDLIFEQIVRFKSGNKNNYSEWKEFKLSDLGNTFNGLSGKTKEHFGVGQKYIQYKQIFDSVKINIANCAFVEVQENENQNIVQYGDVFFTISSETPEEIGMSSVLLENVDNVYLNSFCFGFRTNSLDELIPEFSQFLFRSNKFRNEIVKLAQGSTRYNMSKIEFLKLKVKLPCKDEQIKIAQFLSSINEKINVESELLTQYENQKKYLLQNLFV